MLSAGLAITNLSMNLTLTGRALCIPWRHLRSWTLLCRTRAPGTSRHVRLLRLMWSKHAPGVSEWQNIGAEPVRIFT